LMRRTLGVVWRLLKGLPQAIVAPVFLFISALLLLATDLFCQILPKRPITPDTKPETGRASIVIPNWNGRDLLEKYLPSILAAAEQVPGTEVIVVDDASTDGSPQLVLERFPQVRLIAMDENLGFGGGSNRGFEHARNDIVVLLNSDM